LQGLALGVHIDFGTLLIPNFDLKTIMKDLTTYLSTAPVVSFFYFSFLAGLLIEINRFYPDALIFPFLN